MLLLLHCSILGHCNAIQIGASDSVISTVKGISNPLRAQHTYGQILLVQCAIEDTSQYGGIVGITIMAFQINVNCRVQRMYTGICAEINATLYIFIYYIYYTYIIKYLLPTGEHSLYIVFGTKNPQSQLQATLHCVCVQSRFLQLIYCLLYATEKRHFNLIVYFNNICCSPKVRANVGNIEQIPMHFTPTPTSRTNQRKEKKHMFLYR